MNALLNPGEKRIEESDLLSFLKEIECDRMQFRLLCFWGRHPRAKLSFYTCSHALHASGYLLRQAVTSLVQKGVLITTQNAGGLTTYTLSQIESQEYIQQIGSMDWSSLKKIEVELESGQDNSLEYALYSLNK